MESKSTSIVISEEGLIFSSQFDAPPPTLLSPNSSNQKAGRSVVSVKRMPQATRRNIWEESTLMNTHPTLTHRGRRNADMLTDLVGFIVFCVLACFFEFFMLLHDR